jgi:hypothetical protein
MPRNRCRRRSLRRHFRRGLFDAESDRQQRLRVGGYARRGSQRERQQQTGMKRKRQQKKKPETEPGFRAACNTSLRSATHGASPRHKPIDCRTRPCSHVRASRPSEQEGVSYRYCPRAIGGCLRITVLSARHRPVDRYRSVTNTERSVVLKPSMIWYCLSNRFCRRASSDSALCSL